MDNLNEDNSNEEKPQSLFRSKFFKIEYAERSKNIADPRNSLEFTADSEADAVRRFYEEFFSDITGTDLMKKAITIALFSTFDEPVNVLILGDPGSAKTLIVLSSLNTL